MAQRLTPAPEQAGGPSPLQDIPGFDIFTSGLLSQLIASIDRLSMKLDLLRIFPLYRKDSFTVANAANFLAANNELTIWDDGEVVIIVSFLTTATQLQMRLSPGGSFDSLNGTGNLVASAYYNFTVPVQQGDKLNFTHNNSGTITVNTFRVGFSRVVI